MAHELVENHVIENQITDLMNTKLDARSLMTIDTSLQGVAGLKKIVYKRTYTGTVEKLAKGAKNTVTGTVTMTNNEYVVNRYQQTFKYNDQDVMQDPRVLDALSNGAALVNANQVKTEYFEELGKISNSITFPKTGSFGYNTVVDALEEIGCEAEEDTFIVMGSDLKAMIRKDSEFMASKQGEILYTGQFGTIAGVPCVFSKLVPKDTAYITKKSAIKFFVKKEGDVEQFHDIETKENKVVYERYGLVALVDDTESVKITRATA